MKVALIMAAYLLIPVSAAAPPQVDTRTRNVSILRQAEIMHNIPYGLLVAVCTVESGLRADALRKHDGSRGRHSYGLCQIKLATARGEGFKGEARLLYDPIINVEFSARFLRRQARRYGGSWVQAVAAYNAGRVIRCGVGRGFCNARYLEKVMEAYVNRQ